MAALLEVDGLAKSFRGLRAVTDVSFAVETREIFGIIGPNGAGKTTLFSMIAGALRPDRGRVSFDGQDITGLRPDQVCDAGIGRTFQIVQPFAELTVLENVTVGALHAHREVAAARQAAAECLELLELGHKRHMHAANLTLPDAWKSPARWRPGPSCCCWTR
jgi:branched-chain amino acid transport system ATP-binding protein